MCCLNKSITFSRGTFNFELLLRINNDSVQLQCWLTLLTMLTPLLAKKETSETPNIVQNLAKTFRILLQCTYLSRKFQGYLSPVGYSSLSAQSITLETERHKRGSIITKTILAMTNAWNTIATPQHLWCSSEVVTSFSPASSAPCWSLYFCWAQVLGQEAMTMVASCLRCHSLRGPSRVFEHISTALVLFPCSLTCSVLGCHIVSIRKNNFTSQRGSGMLYLSEPFLMNSLKSLI